MKKLIISMTILFFIICGVCIGVGFAYKYPNVNMVYVNEVVQSIKLGQVPDEILYDYTLVEKSGKVVQSTYDTPDMAYETRLSKAYANGNIVIDFDEDSKIIFYVKSSETFYRMRNTLIWLVAVACILLAFAIAVSLILIYSRTIKPFGKLKGFASDVAKGNLDSPLILDKYMSFGAFGEAFDIMRNNLRESRKAEQNANLERSRLLQEIGHEIKTPLSTIKAMSECGLAVSKNNNYAVILDKANCIDNMINDFYQKALEEEGQLNVFITKHSTQDFAELIATCDYNKRIVFGDIANCNVLFDKNRMVQIVDNIIANSYKYADTQIDVGMSLIDKKLEVTFKDYGEGVAPEQLSYIMDRFYRGEKTAEKLGQGLGLNICRKLIMRMGGEMECFNENGFVVKLRLPVYEG